MHEIKLEGQQIYSSRLKFLDNDKTLEGWEPEQIFYDTFKNVTNSSIIFFLVIFNLFILHQKQPLSSLSLRCLVLFVSARHKELDYYHVPLFV